MKTVGTFIGLVFCLVLLGAATAFAIAYNFEIGREYTVIITRATPPAQVIGTIQAGLNKTEAEAVAFQLNEIMTREKAEWRAVAAVQKDISTLPRKKP